ncbi:tetratricopeptide repeat protein [Streptomyces griseoruber]|uniref:tetratricopeptide repeat protein n=1 Tax=Streptomyces griseoruber TaxID=1943 RepID=UPI0037873800
MSRLSREKKREQNRTGRPAALVAPLDVHVRAGGPATIGGVPVAAADGEEIQHAVLGQLHRIAVATGHPVLATVHDERIGYVVPLRIDTDGSSHFTAEPLRAPAVSSAQMTSAAPVAPGAPAGPVGPIAPAAPTVALPVLSAPAASAAPVAPGAPAGPIAPAAPTVALPVLSAPAASAAPAAPVAPGAPAGPITPAAPTVALPVLSAPAAPVAPVNPAPEAPAPAPEEPRRDKPTHVLRQVQAPEEPQDGIPPLPPAPPAPPATPAQAPAPGTVVAPTGVFGPPPAMDLQPEGAVPASPEHAPSPFPESGVPAAPDQGQDRDQDRDRASEHAPHRFPEAAFTTPEPELKPLLAFTPTPDPESAAALDPDPKPTPARGFDAVAEAVLGDDPRTLPGTDGAPALLGEPMAHINEAVRAGRIDVAAGLAERTVLEASGTLGPEHPEVLRLRELGAYIAYLAGDPLRAFHVSLDLARIRRRARDGEAAYGNVQSAAAAWRAVRDPLQGLNLGTELLGLWTELTTEEGPAADDVEQLESARARMLRLAERARRSGAPGR